MSTNLLAVAERIDGIGVGDIDIAAYEHKRIPSIFTKSAVAQRAMKLWYEDEVTLSLTPSKNQSYPPGRPVRLSAFERWFTELTEGATAIMHWRDVGSIMVTGAVFSGTHPRLHNPYAGEQWLDPALYAKSDTPLVQLQGQAHFPDFEGQTVDVSANFLWVGDASEAPTGPLINLVHLRQQYRKS